MPLEATLVPQVLLHVALYVPATLTCMVLPLAPLLQLTLPTHPLAVNVAFAPSQQMVLSVDMVGAFGLLPVVITTGVEAPLAPQALLHVALYVPAVVTLMLLPVAFVLHLMLPVQLLAVKVALSPSHNAVLLAVTVGAFGTLPVVITIGVLALLTPQMVSHTAV